MRSSLLPIGLLLWLAGEALAESKNAINVFKRAETMAPSPVERTLDFNPHRKLDKRASPYLTEATQSKLWQQTFWTRPLKPVNLFQNSSSTDLPYLTLTSTLENLMPVSFQFLRRQMSPGNCSSGE